MLWYCLVQISLRQMFLKFERHPWQSPVYWLPSCKHRCQNYHIDQIWNNRLRCRIGIFITCSFVEYWPGRHRKLSLLFMLYPKSFHRGGNPLPYWKLHRLHLNWDIHCYQAHLDHHKNLLQFLPTVPCISPRFSQSLDTSPHAHHRGTQPTLSVADSL